MSRVCRELDWQRISYCYTRDAHSQRINQATGRDVGIPDGNCWYFRTYSAVDREYRYQPGIAEALNRYPAGSGDMHSMSAWKIPGFLSDSNSRRRAAYFRGYLCSIVIPCTNEAISGTIYFMSSIKVLKGGIYKLTVGTVSKFGLRDCVTRDWLFR